MRKVSVKWGDTVASIVAAKIRVLVRAVRATLRLLINQILGGMRMSDVMEKPSNKFPKTVSACHVEIIRLRNQIAEHDDMHGDIAHAEETAGELRREIETAGAEIEALQKTIGERDERIEELEGEAEGREDPVAAIDQFLFEVERPVGRFNFDVVHGAAADRAILGLFAAVGRNP
jgi:septal ring factor EnvC (AmiA/AmiB activator)